jgi:hypothetical protein
MSGLTGRELRQLRLEQRPPGDVDPSAVTAPSAILRASVRRRASTPGGHAQRPDARRINA